MVMIILTHAVASGASAVICETLPENPDKRICWIKTTDSAKALGHGCIKFLWKSFSITETCWCYRYKRKNNNCNTALQDVYQAWVINADYSPQYAIILMAKNFLQLIQLPIRFSLTGYCLKWSDEGCDYAFMEVSSHSADQQRIAGLKFAGGIFTNLTHDHLDYHKTFDNYLAAKKSFFDSLAPGCICTGKC